MNHLVKILAALLLAVPLAPAFAQAMSDTPPVPTTDTATAQETILADTLIQTQDSSVLSDVASSTQETISADTLVQTQDPSLLLGDTTSSTVLFDIGTTTASSTPDTPPILLDATSTVAIDIVPITDEALPADAVPLVPDIQTQDVTPPESEIVATMPIADIAPKSEFKFAIRSNRIATEKVPEWQKKGADTPKKHKGQQADTVVTDAPNIALDAASGAPIVSGACSNVYYVILLYRNETDYSTNPASYILNNAYPCTGGQYTYTINSVPSSIPSGTYYLLVGEMGERGSWTPITSLVPIDITR